MATAPANHCKRCSRQLDYSGSGWADVSADDIEAVLQTLPPARGQELRTALRGGSGGNRRSVIEPAELSRFFSNAFRTDRVSRRPDGAVAPGGGMRGSLALVMDSCEQELRGAAAGEDRRGSAETHAAGPGGDPGTSNGSSQGDSFILLSSSQLHPHGLGADMAQLSLASDSSGGGGGGGGGGPGQSAQSNGRGQTRGSVSSDKTQADGQRDSGRLQDDIAATATVIGRLADGLRSRSGLEYPVCEECAEVLARLLDREISDCAHERRILDGIGRAAEQIQAGSGDKHGIAADVAELEREIDKQAEVERALGDTLGMLDAQLAELCGQIDALEREAHAADARRRE
ncbi:hypothetical protein H4R21_003205, partial [Coemansia helicoidea]